MICRKMAFRKTFNLVPQKPRRPNRPPKKGLNDSKAKEVVDERKWLFLKKLGEKLVPKFQIKFFPVKISRPKFPLPGI